MIYVVIPNFNGIKHLEVCLKSISRQSCKDFKVIIVDNGSKDDSVNFIKNNFPEIELIQENYNSGFSIAVNTGIKKALENSDCDYILLLNNDIECEINFFEEMKNGFVEKSIGAVGCKMLNFYNRKIIDDTGNFIKLIGSPYRRGSLEKDIGQYNKPEYVFGVCAAAAIYKKEVFNEIGFFDEDFFAYYEDVDFCFRMQLFGYKCFYNPKAICYHKRGGTTEKISGFQTLLCEKNLIALRIKNYPFWIYVKLTPLFIIGRLKRFFDFLSKYGINIFINAVKGYFSGLIEIPKSIYKRRNIQKLKKVDSKYIYELLKNRN